MDRECLAGSALDFGNMVDNDACSNACKLNVGGVTYSQAFMVNVTPVAQCTAWNTFRASIGAGPYTKVTVRGSLDMVGKSCTGANAQTLCQNLKNGLATNLACDGNTWVIGNCGNGVELSASGSLCQCTSPGWIVRPCIGNSNWGGMNGPTCGAANQTLEVQCQ